MTWIPSIDNWIVIVGILCAVSCALLGNFLVLRRMSMMGDAISHAVLPGLAGGFLLVLFLQSNDAMTEWWPWLAQTIESLDPRNPFVMLIGAAVVGILTALFTEWVHGFGKVDRGASMGVVFTTLFAIGLILIVEATEEHRVDLDPGCVLYGAIELAPMDRWEIGGLEIPRAAVILGGVLLMNTTFICLFFKELRISSFDPALATTLGINARMMHYVLMTMVAITTVASFETVGSILVIAMLIVPAAAAHLLTDRLGSMIVVSVILGAASAPLGHSGAILFKTTTASMMACAAGAIFLVVMLAAPRHGVLMRLARRFELSLGILREDLLGFLYRLEETGLRAATEEFRNQARLALDTGPVVLSFAIRHLLKRRLIEVGHGEYLLTERGRRRARGLVRSHRLWETYLVNRLGLRPDHVHGTAMRLEHVTDVPMQEELIRHVRDQRIDPHGRPIPEDETQRATENHGENAETMKPQMNAD